MDNDQSSILQREAMINKKPEEEILDLIELAAGHYEKEFGGCSRSVLKALQDHIPLGNGTTLKASTPLAGGIGLHGETCGALLGGLLAVGIIFAKDDMKDRKALSNSLIAGFKLVRKVEKGVGSIKCFDIQKSKLGRYYNLANPQEAKKFIEVGGPIECSKVVGKIARITGEFILDYLNEGK